MKFKSLCVLKYCFILAMVIISLHVAFSYLKNKEGFINLEKKYKNLKKNMKKNMNGKLESMINILPNFNIRKKAHQIKRKYI